MKNTSRISKGLAMYLDGYVEPHGKDYVVIASKKDKSYLVSQNKCDCPDFTIRGHTCKHIHAVHYYQAGEVA